MDIKNTVQDILGFGAMFGSKGQYRADNKNHMVRFNSNVCTKEDGKIWHGDLDLTISENEIRTLASKLGKTIYVLSEMDARFENETKPLFEKALYSTDGETFSFDEEYYHRDTDGRLYEKEYVPPTLTAEEIATIKATYVESEFKVLGEIPPYKATKKCSPVEAFMLAICKKLEIKKPAKLDTWKIWVSDTVYDGLKEATVAWAKKHNPHLTDYRVQSSVDWLFFDIAPQHFSYDPDWVKADEFYVKGEYVITP